MNRVCLVGNLTRDPELKTTSGGKPYASFGIAVNDPFREDAHFFDVTCWGKTAENVAKHQSKGCRVGVDGRLEYRKWEKDGQKRSAVSVSADQVHFLTPKAKEEPKGLPF